MPEEIDHDDGNGINNKWDNLNEVSHSKNGKNTRLKSNNRSGHNGVFWNKSNEKWRARAMVDGKQKHLGYFERKEDAIDAIESNKSKLGFNKNHGLNRPL